MPEFTPDGLSLLWPHGAASAPQNTPTRTFLIEDLNLERLVRALCLDFSYRDTVREVLLHLSTDPAVIHYRQAIIADLLRSPELVQQLEIVLQAIVDLENYLATPQWTKNTLRQVAWRLSELENYTDTLLRLHETLQAGGDALQSQGLQALRDTVQAMTQDEMFVALRRELPDLLPKVRAVGSVTIGINLDSEMRPLSAILLSAHSEPFTSESLIGKLFRRRKRDTSNENGAGAMSGGGPLHDARELDTGRNDLKVELEDRNSPFMPPLFKDLSNLMDNTSKPIVKLLRDYTGITTRFIIALKPQIGFYLGAVRLIQRLQQAGLPMCEPQLVPMPERRAHIDGLYNINLALQLLQRQDDLSAEVVGNDFYCDAGATGRIFILTGPNQGGKTTYTQAVGLAQLLCQAGLHVPAHSAAIAPVDGIYTHFATEERPEQEAGRLGEEARRLHTIFQHASRHSLILLNETFASTSAAEGLFLARDVVRVLRRLGARAIFATHLHELAADAATLNAESTTADTSQVVSLVSQVQLNDQEPENSTQPIKRTYKIVPGPPMSKSYALDLAARYGISYEQLVSLLKDRQQIN
jgi:DNA mismatch repair protein MutS